jgi:hypothetical protein
MLLERIPPSGFAFPTERVERRMPPAAPEWQGKWLPTNPVRLSRLLSHAPTSRDMRSC